MQYDIMVLKYNERTEYRERDGGEKENMPAALWHVQMALYGLQAARLSDTSLHLHGDV